MIRTSAISHRLARSARAGFELFVAALREIFDESAYKRFLRRNSLANSPAAYAGYLRESRELRERRPRCC